MFCDLISVTSSFIVIKIVPGLHWQSTFKAVCTTVFWWKRLFQFRYISSFCFFFPHPFPLRICTKQQIFAELKSLFFFFFQTCTTSWLLLQKCNDVINAKSICRLAWQPGTGKVSDIVLSHLNPYFASESNGRIQSGQAQIAPPGSKEKNWVKFPFREHKKLEMAPCLSSRLSLAGVQLSALTSMKQSWCSE